MDCVSQPFRVSAGFESGWGRFWSFWFPVNILETVILIFLLWFCYWGHTFAWLLRSLRQCLLTFTLGEFELFVVIIFFRFLLVLRLLLPLLGLFSFFVSCFFPRLELISKIFFILFGQITQLLLHCFNFLLFFGQLHCLLVRSCHLISHRWLDWFGFVIFWTVFQGFCKLQLGLTLGF